MLGNWPEFTRAAVAEIGRISFSPGDDGLRVSPSLDGLGKVFPGRGLSILVWIDGTDPLAMIFCFFILSFWVRDRL